MSDTSARLELLQRVVLVILGALMFYVIALYPVVLMARFQPDDVVHYGVLKWFAVVLVLHWAAVHLLFSERPAETRPGRQTLAVTAALLLAIGTFAPIVSFPFVGDVDFFREGYGDGYILLIMTGVSLALAVTGRWKQVLVPALGSLAVILWTFLGVQDTILQARSGASAELAGNPHDGLAASVMQSIQWEWGWLVLFAASGLLVYSAARRDPLEAAYPPPATRAVESEPEVVPAEGDDAGEPLAATAEAPEDEAETAVEAAVEEAAAPAEAPEHEPAATNAGSAADDAVPAAGEPAAASPPPEPEAEPTETAAAAGPEPEAAATAPAPDESGEEKPADRPAAAAAAESATAAGDAAADADVQAPEAAETAGEKTEPAVAEGAVAADAPAGPAEAAEASAPQPAAATAAPEADDREADAAGPTAGEPEAAADSAVEEPGAAAGEPASNQPAASPAAAADATASETEPPPETASADAAAEATPAATAPTSADESAAATATASGTSDEPSASDSRRATDVTRD